MGICGFDKVFESFNKKNPAHKGMNHDIDKIRDKYTEILDAVGVKKDLFRAKEKVTDIDGKTVKGGSYIFPEESVEFCVGVIQRYTSPNFKKLRSADFNEMAIEEITFLVWGFCKMLCNLGYSENIVLEQYHAMERRMSYKLRLASVQLDCRLDAIRELAKEYKNSYVSFNYCDKIYFLRYMASKVEATKHGIESVYGSYTDIRSDELSDMALEESYKESPKTSIEMINREMFLSDALEHDSEYQKLVRQQEKLIAEDTFIKNKQARFKKIQTKLAEIRERNQIELFGKLLDEMEDAPLKLRHPMDILKEAVEYAESWMKDCAMRAEAETVKTPEDIEREKADAERMRQLLEERGINLNFDLPNTEEQEKEIFVQSGNTLWEVKGTIHLPCHCTNGQVTVYQGTKGKCAMKCPGCGSYVLIDYDKMSAERLYRHGFVQRIEK